jgi:cytochrome c oxidase subunit II
MIKFLIFVIVLLVIITVSHIVRILELASQLGGDTKQDVINHKDNRRNGAFMMWFLILGLIGLIYQTVAYSKLALPVAASEHGVKTDLMLNVTFVIIGIVFFVTQILLFYYGFRYSQKDGQKAYFFPDSHKLEIVWTVIPTIVLVSLVVYGLKTWNKITEPAPANAMKIEIYAKQFDFTSRYAGKDSVLGRSNYKLIAGANALGIDSMDANAFDDVITRELHIPVKTPVLLLFSSRDVIHSMYLPHFRLQMNAVPGMTTQFFFIPTITTNEMKKITKNEKFEYIMLCNKVCGVAHYNMNMKVVIDTKEDYDKWMQSQKTFIVSTPAKDTAAVVSLDKENKLIADK